MSVHVVGRERGRDRGDGGDADRPADLLVGVDQAGGDACVGVADAGEGSDRHRHVRERQADAGIASGLINTNQQIGGAIGVAAATTIATTFTTHYVNAHAGTTAFSGAALTHGFEIAFYVLAAVAGLGALLAALMLESKPAQAEPELELTGEAALELEAA